MIKQLRKFEAAPLAVNRSVTRSTIAPSAVTDALFSIGVRPGSVVLVHPDAIVAAQFPLMPNEQRLDLLIEAIDAAIGSRRNARDARVQLQLHERGAVRRLQHSQRGGHGNRKIPHSAGRSPDFGSYFQFCLQRADGARIVRVPVNECFGAESVFAALHHWNAHIVDLGCSMNRGGTFVHYVETAHGVDYRYKKVFSVPLFRLTVSPAMFGCLQRRDLTRRSDADLRRLQKRLRMTGSREPWRWGDHESWR